MRGEEMKFWRLTISLLIIILLMFIVTGFRFTALSAAKSNPLSQKTSR
jgi:Tfp pilus assembly protein PilO